MGAPPDRRPPVPPSDWLRARAEDMVDGQSFPHRPDHIYLLEIGVTWDCQCRCVHCALPHPDEAPDASLLTCEEMVDLCRQARQDLGAEVVELFGGEPLVRPDIVSIVEGSARYLTPWMSSNGMALTQKKARELKDAGLRLIILSLDSADPATHDAIRGTPGCHAAVMRALDHCREIGLTAHLSACVTRAMVSSGEVDRLIDFARASAAEKLCLLPAKVAGRFRGRRDVLLTEPQMAWLWSRLVREGGRVYVETESNWSRNVFKCFCNRDWMYVSPHGAVQACGYVPFDFGNVRERPLKELYARMFRHPVFADRSLLNLCLMQNPDFVDEHFQTAPADGLYKVRFDGD
jgi:MoaA/NifB/PqqE/SkfB family radical SAM enzyme